MQKSNRLAFIIAMVIYFPIVLWIYWQVIKPPPKMQQKDLLPLTQFQIIKSEPNPKISQQTAPSPANKTTNNEQSIAKNLSVEDLNRIFAAASNKTTTNDSNESYTPNKEIQSLYGDLILDLREEEKKYLESNLNSIGLITQRYLKYPYLAGENRMHGEVILSFTLMPNGDITPIKLHKSSGFSLLDDNSIYTVEVAYKDYPKPKEPTRIRLRVLYTLY